MLFNHGYRATFGERLVQKEVENRRLHKDKFGVRLFSPRVGLIGDIFFLLPSMNEHMHNSTVAISQHTRAPRAQTFSNFPVFLELFFAFTTSTFVSLVFEHLFELKVDCYLLMVLLLEKFGFLGEPYVL